MSFRILMLLSLLSASAFADDFSIERFAADSTLARSGAVRVGNADLIYSAQLVAGGDGELARQQTDLWKQMIDLLSAVDLSPADVVKLNLYVTDDAHAAATVPALKNLFAAESFPAVSWVTTALPDEQARLALDFVAARRPSPESRVLPAAIDGQRRLGLIPAAASSRVFISGQAEKGDGALADATQQTMASLFRTLAFLELSSADVVQVKAFLAPMAKSDEAIKAIQAAFAPAASPPIVLVEWKSPSLPIEIELVAASRSPLESPRPAAEYLAPPDMKQSPSYSRIVRVQSPAIIFLSGLYGAQADPDSEAELRELFAETKSLCEAAGSDLRHLVKATYYVSSKGSSDQHNRLRPEYYDPARPPAASKAIVNGVGRAGRTITWDMIAVPNK